MSDDPRMNDDLVDPIEQVAQAIARQMRGDIGRPYCWATMPEAHREAFRRAARAAWAASPLHQAVADFVAAHDAVSDEPETPALRDLRRWLPQEKSRRGGGAVSGREGVDSTATKQPEITPEEIAWLRELASMAGAIQCPGEEVAVYEKLASRRLAAKKWVPGWGEGWVVTEEGRALVAVLARPEAYAAAAAALSEDAGLGWAVEPPRRGQ